MDLCGILLDMVAIYYIACKVIGKRTRSTLTHGEVEILSGEVTPND